MHCCRGKICIEFNGHHKLKNNYPYSLLIIDFPDVSKIFLECSVLSHIFAQNAIELQDNLDYS